MGVTSPSTEIDTKLSGYDSGSIPTWTFGFDL